MGDTDKDSCRTGDILRFPLGNQTELVHSRDNHQTKVLSISSANHLSRCRDFKTVEQHAQFIKESAGALEPMDFLVRQLQDLLKDGLLVSKQDILKKFESLKPPAKDAKPITSICFPTRDRVESLQRGVISFIENTLKHSRIAAFRVADNSPSEAVQFEYRQMLKSLSKKYGLKIFYAGQKEKQAFVQKLSSQGLPADVLNFALFGTEISGSGANRNALLLDACGENILMTDDDTVCRLTNAPGSGKALTFISGQDPFEYCFFPNADAMLNAVPFTDENILSLHEQFLGKDLHSALAECSSVNFDRTSPAFLRKILSGRGKILAAQTGIIGDSGSGSPTGLLSLTGESRKRFLKSEADYKNAIVNRLELKKASFPSIVEGSFCMTTSIGLCLEELLPPFVPVHRNSDGIFGAALKECFGDGYIVQIPWALLHLPQDARSFSPENIWDTSVGFQMDEIISQAMNLFSPAAYCQDGPGKLKKLGGDLINFGGTDVREFAQILIPKMLNARKFYLEFLQNSLKIHSGEPRYWAEDVKKRVRKILSTLEEGKDLRISPDGKFQGNPEESWSYRQNLVRKFGELLFYWPDMFECSQSLRAAGHVLAQVI